MGFSEYVASSGASSVFVQMILAMGHLYKILGYLLFVFDPQAYLFACQRAHRALGAGQSPAPMWHR